MSNQNATALFRINKSVIECREVCLCRYLPKIRVTCGSKNKVFMSKLHLRIAIIIEASLMLKMSNVCVILASPARKTEW